MTKAFAFFDVDGTLLKGKSMFEFNQAWYSGWSQMQSPHPEFEPQDVVAILSTLIESDVPREVVNRRYYDFFAGRPVDLVESCGRAWATRHARQPSSFHQEVLAELERLRAQGIEPVLVSGSFEELLRPIAEYLRVSHVLATRLVHDGCKYTGKFVPPQTIGAGKAIAIRQFLTEQGVAAADCWAFGDDLSDAQMLEAVGHPVAVIGDPRLGELARTRGWPQRLIAAVDEVARARAVSLVQRATVVA